MGWFHFVVLRMYPPRNREPSSDQGGRRQILDQDLLGEDIVRGGVDEVLLTTVRKIRRSFNNVRFIGRAHRRRDLTESK